MTMELYPELQKLKEVVLATSDSLINVVVIDGSIGGGKSTFARTMLSDLAFGTDYTSDEFKGMHILWLMLIYNSELHSYLNGSYENFSIRADDRLDKFVGTNIAGAIIDLADVKKVANALETIQQRIMSRFNGSKKTFYIFVVINTKDQRDFFESFISSYPECVKINYLKLLAWEVNPGMYSGKFVKVQTGVTPKCELVEDGVYEYKKFYTSIPEELLPSFLHDEATFCRDMLAL